MSAATQTRARTATLVIVGPPDRLAATTQWIEREHAGALHIVQIPTGDQPGHQPDADVVWIPGLRPEYVDNAIAAVRLSSLPTAVWWRGGPPEGLDGVARLADRVILDVDDPSAVWPRTPPLFERTSLTDVRWARLTRWRAAMAHFFDMPQVQAATGSFRTLRVAGSDRYQCALFAGWLDSSLAWNGRVSLQCTPSSSFPMTSVTLEGDAGSLRLHLTSNSSCLETEARMEGQVLAARVVSLGNQNLDALLAEELRVRSRDLAFEAALQSALERPV